VAVHRSALDQTHPGNVVHPQVLQRHHAVRERDQKLDLVVGQLRADSMVLRELDQQLFAWRGRDVECVAA